MGQADYIIQQRVRPHPVPGLISLYLSSLISMFGSRLEQNTSLAICELSLVCRVRTFPKAKAGPGQHLSSQQRHYHHNLSEGGAKTVINVVIINDIHLSYPSHNCIKYLREKVVLQFLT